MPASYLIDQPRGVVFSRAWGVLTDEEVLAHAKVLRADARLTPSLRQVADFRDVTKLGVTSEGVRRAARNNPFGPDARRSFVAPLDETLGMLRMFGIYMDADASQFRTFERSSPRWNGSAWTPRRRGRESSPMPLSGSPEEGASGSETPAYF